MNFSDGQLLKRDASAKEIHPRLLSFLMLRGAYFTRMFFNRLRERKRARGREKQQPAQVRPDGAKIKKLERAYSLKLSPCIASQKSHRATLPYVKVQTDVSVYALLFFYLQFSGAI